MSYISLSCLLLCVTIKSAVNACDCFCHFYCVSLGELIVKSCTCFQCLGLGIYSLLCEGGLYYSMFFFMQISYVNISKIGKIQLLQHNYAVKFKLCNVKEKKSSLSLLVSIPSQKGIYLNVNIENNRVQR